MSSSTRAGLGLALLAVLLAGSACARQQQAERESPSTTQHLATGAERARVHVECLRAHGIAAEVVEGQGYALSIETPPGQEEFVTRIDNECGDEVEAKYPSPPPPTPEEFYYLFLEAAECLEAEGYSIPDPPTLEQFVEDWNSVGNKGPWTPHAYLPAMGLEAWARINRVCPQPGPFSP